MKSLVAIPKLITNLYNLSKTVCALFPSNKILKTGKSKLISYGYADIKSVIPTAYCFATPGRGVKAQRYGEATIIGIDLGSTPQPRIPVANEGLGWDSLLKM